MLLPSIEQPSHNCYSKTPSHNSKNLSQNTQINITTKKENNAKAYSWRY